MKQLLLVRHGATTATERRAFGADEPLTAEATAQAAGLAGTLPAGAEIRCSPKLRTRQTAEAAGVRPTIDPALAECSFGRWEGQSFAEIQAAEPDLVGGWLVDPHAAPPGGESLTEFAARVARWLDGVGSGSGTLVAITHAGVIRAAVVHALGAPLDAFWRLDVDPLSITELTAHDGRWTLHRLNVRPA